MAAEDALKEALRNQDSGAATEDQDEPKSKGGKLKLILIPVIILLQAGAAYHIVFNVLLQHPNHVEAPKVPKENLEVGHFYEINDIVINPAESGGRRYLVMELGLETNDSDLIKEAESKDIWIRDAIITLLANKTSDDLMELTARKKLKKEILDLLNRKMIKGRFDRIYFKKYIIQ